MGKNAIEQRSDRYGRCSVKKGGTKTPLFWSPLPLLFSLPCFRLDMVSFSLTLCLAFFTPCPTSFFLGIILPRVKTSFTSREG